MRGPGQSRSAWGHWVLLVLGFYWTLGITEVFRPRKNPQFWKKKPTIIYHCPHHYNSNHAGCWGGKHSWLAGRRVHRPELSSWHRWRCWTVCRRLCERPAWRCPWCRRGRAPSRSNRAADSTPPPTSPARRRRSQRSRCRADLRTWKSSASSRTAKNNTASNAIH